MTEERDPPRLREADGGAPARLRELFDGAAREQPTPADVARWEAKLGPLLDEAPAAPPPSARPGSVALKLGLGALVLGGVAALVLSQRSTTEDGSAPTARAAPSAGITKAPTAPAATPAPSAGPAPAATPPTAPLPSPSVAPLPAASQATAPGPASATGGVPEDQLLESARRALRQNPTLALALTREHQQRFAGGALTQEREVIAIEALRRLGRDAEAERRKARFEQRYPGSAHQPKLDAPLPKR